MKRYTLELVNNEYYLNGEWCLCANELHWFFEIPPLTKVIDVCLSGKPSKNSFKVTVLDTYHIRIHGEKKKYEQYMLWTTVNLIRDFGLPCYVSIEI